MCYDVAHNEPKEVVEKKRKTMKTNKASKMSRLTHNKLSCQSFILRFEENISQVNWCEEMAFREWVILFSFTSTRSISMKRSDLLWFIWVMIGSVLGKDFLFAAFNEFSSSIFIGGKLDRTKFVSENS